MLNYILIKQSNRRDIVTWIKMQAISILGPLGWQIYDFVVFVWFYNDLLIYNVDFVVFVGFYYDLLIYNVTIRCFRWVLQWFMYLYPFYYFALLKYNLASIILYYLYIIICYCFVLLFGHSVKTYCNIAYQTECIENSS